MVKVIKADSTSASYWFSLVVVAAILIVGGFFLFGRKPEDPDKLWAEAQAELQANRGDKAESLIKKVGKLREPTPLDDMLKAQIAIFHKKDDEAIALLNKVPDSHQMGSQARLIAGQIELRRSHPRRAEAHFLRALEIDPRLIQARRELIYIYGILLRRADLKKQFQALSDASVLTYENVFVWCLTRSSMWDPREQLPRLKKYVELDPDDRWSRIALAETLRQLGLRAESEKTLQPLPNSDPEALVLRVRLALDRNADEETIQALLKQGPDDNAELSRTRGKFALAHKRGDEALRAYKAAYKADPEHRDTQIGMAQALTMTGDTVGAAPFMKRARDIEKLGTLVQQAAMPDSRTNVPLIKSLGAACEAADRIPEAKAWYTLVVNANPLDSEAQKALFRLKKAESADNGESSTAVVAPGSIAQ